ncbi:hypothetical protein As57867_014852, partial [Aphanomyces stellatus]
DGDVPHPCVGLARRIMVPSLDAQSAIMVECVQNHTPQVLLVDEVGRANEVEAARTCKQRGVRMIASAHGSLRKLLKNKPLRCLVGGVESVTRAGDPVFEVIVELEKGQYSTWRTLQAQWTPFWRARRTRPKCVRALASMASSLMRFKRNCNDKDD